MYLNLIKYYIFDKLSYYNYLSNIIKIYYNESIIDTIKLKNYLETVSYNKNNIELNDIKCIRCKKLFININEDYTYKKDKKYYYEMLNIQNNDFIITYKGTFINGKSKGFRTSKFISGNTLCNYEFFENGKLNGLHICFYQGKLVFIGNHKNNELNGFHIGFKNNIYKYHYIYKDGYPQANKTIFIEKFKKSFFNSSYSYDFRENEKMNGILVFFSKGKLEKIVSYEKDTLEGISIYDSISIEFNDDGNTIKSIDNYENGIFKEKIDYY